jgi:O-succinylbenzoate synthase
MRRDFPGEVRPHPVHCNGTLGGGDPASVATGAADLAAAGFRTLKVKVGTGSDRERLAAVREAVGPGVALRIDANGAWDVERAVAEITAIDAAVGLELAEQPCQSLAELTALRERVNVPIVADESVSSLAEAQEARSLDAATLKLAKVGGPREALRIAAALPCYLSSALDSPLGIAAAVHTAQALPGEGFVAGLAHGLATSSLFADNVAADEHLHGPEIEAPTAPGLGVEVDRDAVERLAIR